MIKKLEKLEKAKQYLTFLGLDKSKRLKRDVSRIFCEIGTYIEFTKAPPLLVSRGYIFKIVTQNALKMYSGPVGSSICL